MLALWILGSLLEPALGHVRFGLIYFVSLLCGSFGALLLSPDSLTVGASGAVFGLMGAAAVVARNRGLNLMESGLGIWIGLNLLITFTIPNISIGGHIGGLIGGDRCPRCCCSSCATARGCRARARGSRARRSPWWRSSARS